MHKNKGKSTGLELLIEQYERKFETEENINYYSYKDYVRAKRKYIKFVLGTCIYHNSARSN